VENLAFAFPEKAFILTLSERTWQQTKRWSDHPRFKFVWRCQLRWCNFSTIFFFRQTFEKGRSPS